MQRTSRATQRSARRATTSPSLGNGLNECVSLCGGGRRSIRGRRWPNPRCALSFPAPTHSHTRLDWATDWASADSDARPGAHTLPLEPRCVRSSVFFSTPRPTRSRSLSFSPQTLHAFTGHAYSHHTKLRTPRTRTMSTAEMSFSPTHPVEHAEFDVEGILFDMDGTLVDSIKVR